MKQWMMICLFTLTSILTGCACNSGCGSSSYDTGGNDGNSSAAAECCGADRW